jgi:DNA-binding Xre family transcriptional regulator
VIRYKVKEIAQQKGISQTRLGQLAFLDMERMRRIWRDGNSNSANITMQILDRLAKALEVDASELIESAPDEEPQSTEQGEQAE